MIPDERLASSIERYASAFWARKDAARPPVAVSPARNWMPIHFLRAPLTAPFVQPADVTAQLTRTEYEDMALDHPIRSDDWMPFAAIWRGIPWLEAMCGCPIRVAELSLIHI